MISLVQIVFSSKNPGRRLGAIAVLALLALGGTGLLIADEPQVAPDLTVHEWGTFTSIAGADGEAMTWQTIQDSDELPQFVEHLSGVDSKSGLRGTIRMETPVLYFYSPRTMKVSVQARFSRGIMTEWYPHAQTEPGKGLRDPDLHHMQRDGRIVWPAVTLSPESNGHFPSPLPTNRYYAARETSSTPLTVEASAGTQQEKFLFYRGVSAAPLPISAAQKPSGEILIRSLDGSQIPSMMLFERRGTRIGYRWAGPTADEAEIQQPELTGNLESLLGELESVLTSQGLFADEAHAMVETWRDSWFEEGSRLIYVVPPNFVDRILPLTIDPAPGRVVRVFVGRIEIVTPATAEAVKTALSSHNAATLSKYGRFLEPILEILNERDAENRENTDAGH
ncbi:MAG TPA: hypothetical protein VKV39_03550 [Candidatus Sulfotelmatobacter sp.]|nr:hypothetical protein [Candidatus Sulfotelmatobacter sp.]